jgi:2'-5' RNA ligase
MVPSGEATMDFLRQALVILAVAIWAHPSFAQSDLIAIDVLVQPGPRMLSEAEKWNAKMREQTPEGFALDEEHAPHITIIQQFVAESDLPDILNAVEEVKSKFDINGLKMKATGLHHMPAGQIGLAGIVVEPSEQLVALQQAVIDAVKVYAKRGGEESAFVEDKSGTPFDPLLFEYVDTFVPKHTGDKFSPHVTVGVAPLDWLEKMEKKPFEAFDFSASGIAVYQLGNFGTASKRLDHSQ